MELYITPRARWLVNRPPWGLDKRWEVSASLRPCRAHGLDRLSVEPGEGLYVMAGRHEGRSTGGTIRDISPTPPIGVTRPRGIRVCRIACGSPSLRADAESESEAAKRSAAA